MAPASSRSTARFWVWLLVAMVGATALVRVDIAQRRSEFQAQARTAHRLISQACSRIDAVLTTLVLVAGPARPPGANGTASRLPAVYPQVIAAWQRDAAGPTPWPAEAQDALAAAEARSGTAGALAMFDGAAGRYTVVRAGSPQSFAVQVDARRLIAPDEWPWPKTASIRLTLTAEGASIVLHDTARAPDSPAGLTEGFVFTQRIDSPSQPFEFTARQTTGPAEWPWGWLAAWAALSAAAFLGAGRLQKARRERERSEALVRMARAARLGALGELAAGMAHELNQPLAAVLASTQSALRRLREPDGGPEEAARVADALELAVAQARRAAEVVARLRRRLDAQSPIVRQPVDLEALARRLVALLGPELEGHRVRVEVQGRARPALADPVAVEQILHNLLMNAMQALKDQPAASRRIDLRFSEEGHRVVCTVRDHGPGITAEAMPRLFEPFFTTRPDGLGLGLPLCQSLAAAMDGTLELRAGAQPGAEFALELPMADGIGGVPASPAPPEHQEATA